MPAQEALQLSAGPFFILSPITNGSFGSLTIQCQAEDRLPG